MYIIHIYFYTSTWCKHQTRGHRGRVRSSALTEGVASHRRLWALQFHAQRVRQCMARYLDWFVECALWLFFWSQKNRAHIWCSSSGSCGSFCIVPCVLSRSGFLLDVCWHICVWQIHVWLPGGTHVYVSINMYMCL